MDEDLANRLSRVESQIVELKTSQKTQNDSYNVYTYTTGNLAFPEGSIGIKTYKFTFYPKSQKADNVLCEFFVFDASQVNTRFWGTVHLNTPFTCEFDTFSYTEYVPEWARMMYALCVANCEGEAKLELVSQS